MFALSFGSFTAVVPTWHGFSAAQRRAFAADFWQERPLIVRGLLSAEELETFCPLTPADVLDLSCEPAAVSRLVRESGGESPWELRHGPFDHSELPELDETGSAEDSLWTVLVNQVDRAVPEVEALRDRVADFVPRWRVDDVMVSYAKAGCSIGAHVDNYDVILLQGRGSRSWSFQLAGRSCADEVLVEGASVRVLTHFSAEAEVVLQPGDALYLPPRLAHHGVSTSNDCITYSIGFRAPTAAELLRAFGERLAERTPADALFRVPGGVPGGAAESAVADGAAAARGLVDGATVARAREILEDAVEIFLADEAALAEWLGCALTAPRRAADGGGADDGSGGWGAGEGNSLAEEIASGESGRLLLRHTEGAVLAYVDAPVRALFLDGAPVLVAPDALPHLPLLCDARRVTTEELRAPLSESAGLRALLDELVRRDALYVDVEL